MKRKDLLKLLKESGCVFVRHGRSHDLYQNPRTGRKQPVPRHKEIDEQLAKHILKILT
ncbi:MAG: type II toxin-antitoxin system HicA family toxin [Desulfovermiculus sp.]